MARLVPTAIQPTLVRTVTTPDSVQIRVHEYGNPQGLEILLVHPWSACHLSWHKQVAALASEFRLVTLDLRGHGYSEKPNAPEYYQEANRWADELNTVLDAVGFKKAVMVGASTGGRAINDYLTKYGPARVAGVMVTGSTTKAHPSYFGEGRLTMAPMTTENLLDDLEAAVPFVRALTAKPLSPEETRFIHAFVMLTPPWVRRYAFGRTPPDYDEMLRKLEIPYVIAHGTEDGFLLTNGAQYTMTTLRNGKFSLYEGIGHAVYLEDPERFNRELAELRRACPA